MLRRIAGAMLAAVLLLTIAVQVSAQDVGPVRYTLQSDSPAGFPERLVLRHCGPAEDSLGVLRLVDYSPGTGRMVYRCRKNY